MHDPMAIEQLQRAVPSAFAEHANLEKTSERYGFVSTAQVIDQLGRSVLPLVPFAASQTRCRDENNRGYTKHLIRFRQTGLTPFAVGAYPEIIITNSHNTATSFGIDLGLFVFACANGMVVSRGTFESYRIRHNVGNVGEVLDAVYHIVEEFPKLNARVDAMYKHTLTLEQQACFAERALALRFGDNREDWKVKAAKALEVHRYEDATPTVWKTLNVLQENLVRGGQRYTTIKRGNPESAYYSERRDSSRRARTRPVEGIDSSMKLNQGLWALAEEYATA